MDCKNTTMHIACASAHMLPPASPPSVATPSSLPGYYRDQLREARDRDFMMAIARDIILNMEEIAGQERADGLSQRIAILLPSEP